MRCERCGDDIYKYDVCNYCNKKICSNCLKSSRKTSKTTRIAICKDCWGKNQRRKQYKNTGTVEQKPEQRSYY